MSIETNPSPPNTPSPPPQIDLSYQSVAAPRLYRTENLTYTKGGLVILSFWLLWGDFAFNFFETVFGRFLPIYLDDLHASNTLIGVMGGSFAGVVNVLFLPGISRWSDDLRTSIGRRIPLLYVITPLTVGAVVAVGFAPEIGDWMFLNLSAHLPANVTKVGLILGLLCVLVVSFHFFNMVLVNAYNWLIRDVVPLEVMSRFLSWFSMISTVSVFFCLWFAFPLLQTHRREIFLGVGIFYLVAFYLMCFKVKEGKYPPPTPVEDRPGILKLYVVYFRECVKVPLYRNFFIVSLLVTVALQCAGNFVTLFAKNELSLDLVKMGPIFAWGTAVSALFLYPIGWLCDRFSPLHVTLGSIFVIGLGAILAAFFIHSERGFLIYSLTYSFPWMAWGLGQRAASMKLFPVEKFGQFSGALNVFGCGGLIFGNFFIGLLMDLTHSNYRMAFVWTAVISATAIFPMILVIRGWKQHGGHDNYVAPLPG
ncbi:MAG: MFS transporter [Phycisphaerae bacterium]